MNPRAALRCYFFFLSVSLSLEQQRSPFKVFSVQLCLLYFYLFIRFHYIFFSFALFCYFFIAISSIYTLYTLTENNIPRVINSLNSRSLTSNKITLLRTVFCTTLLIYSKSIERVLSLSLSLIRTSMSSRIFLDVSMHCYFVYAFHTFLAHLVSCVQIFLKYFLMQLTADLFAPKSAIILPR